MVDKNKGKAEWLDKLHRGTSIVSEIKYDLLGLAKNLRAVGNDGLANRLTDIATSCDFAHKQLDEGTGTVVCEMVQRS